MIFADERLKKDKDIVLAAVIQNGDALKFADDALKNDKSFILKCIDVAYINEDDIYETLKNDIQILRALDKQRNR